MKPWITRSLLAVVIFELCYLALGNLALNLPLTQTLINQHRPEKYAVHWERAWTWYPFRVHARGVSANGQTTSLQWQVETPAASASLAVLPLLRRTVKINDVEVEDVEYRQRPRPTADKDFAAIREFFPPISGRSLDAPIVAPASVKKGPGWKIVVEAIHAKGKHRVWLYQVRGAVSGELFADASFQLRGGPFSLRNGKLDLQLNSFTTNDTHKLLDRGSITGSLTISPFVPSKNKGIKMLAFVDLDAEISSRADSLAFLNIYLRRFYGMQVNGMGRFSTRLKYAQGKFHPGTELSVASPNLSLSLAAHRIEGTGQIAMEVNSDDSDTLNLAVKFGSLSAYHEHGKLPLFTGEGLEISAKGPTYLVPVEGKRYRAHQLAVRIPSVTAPDLRRYRRYIPAKWPIELHGGSGKLEANATLSRTAFHASLALASGDADIAFKDYRFKTDLDMGLRVDSPALESGAVELSGSYLRLDNATLVTRNQTPENNMGGDKTDQDKARPKPWRSALTIKKGILQLPMPKPTQAEFDPKQWTKTLAGSDLKTILSNADGEFQIDGSVSSLGWINLLLLKNPYNMSIDGSGEIAARLHVDSGRLATGTTVEALAKELDVNVLDYVVKGNGSIAMEVTKGGEHPDLSLNVEVDDAVLQRPADEQAYVEEVTLKLRALSKYSEAEDRNKIVDLQLIIPSASITDMSVYNQYLPEHSPLQLIGGEANLAADIRLKPESAEGFVTLRTEDLRSRVDDQEVSGELTADIKLAGGVPRNMDFDISGSTLLLDKLKVSGEQESFDQPGWSARLDLRTGRVVWRKPIQLQVDAGIQMKDSRPIVAMIANKRGKAGWLNKILTIEDIQGEARLNMENERITIPYAFANSDKLDLGAKGVIDAQTRNGVFYLRFGKLRGILKLRDGDRNFDIINAKQTFEQYSP